MYTWLKVAYNSVLPKLSTFQWALMTNYIQLPDAWMVDVFSGFSGLSVDWYSTLILSIELKNEIFN